MTQTPELLSLSAHELVGWFRSKKTSPVEVLNELKRHADGINPSINAFLAFHWEDAAASARLSADRWQKDSPLGDLDGVPVTIKDHVAVSGWTSRNGTIVSDPAVRASIDAPAVARLKESGAVLFGQTTMPEFGWKGTGDSTLTGSTRNPWNLAKTAGGSSSGAAAAVATGLGPLAVGTDGGGSIRIPCAFTGIFGLKASGGRVPYWPPSQNGTLTHLGPMTRTVRDAAIMLNVLAGPDLRDWSSLPYDPVDFTRDLDSFPSNIKIAFSMDLGFGRIASDVAEVVDAAIHRLRGDGVAIADRDPGFSDPTEWFNVLWKAGMASNTRTYDAQMLTKLDPGLQNLIEQGRHSTAMDYTAALSERVSLGSLLKQFSQDFPILLSPVTCTTAFDVGRVVPPGYSEESPVSPFLTHPFNATTQPAASVPIGLTKDGMPVGLQVVGPMYRDDLVLKVARRIERSISDIDRTPILPNQGA